MERAPNQIWISAPVFADIFAKGQRFNVEVVEGPDPEAAVIGIEMRAVGGEMAPMIVVTYDRPVPEPVFHSRESAFIGE